MRSRTNTVGMTFLDNIDEVALGLVDNETRQALLDKRAQYRVNLEKSFETGTPLVSPIYGLLKVTNRCNSRCRYCSHGRGEPVQYEASTQELLRVIRQMAVLGVRSVNFSGGEATLRSDLGELIAEARR